MAASLHVRWEGPRLGVMPSVDASSWTLWSEDDFLDKCGLSMEYQLHRDTYKDMKRVARSSIIKMGVGKGLAFVDLLTPEKSYILDLEQPNIWKYAPKRAEEVFSRTWARGSKTGSWFNWGWRAVTMLVAKENNLFEIRNREYPTEWVNEVALTGATERVSAKGH